MNINQVSKTNHPKSMQPTSHPSFTNQQMIMVLALTCEPNCSGYPPPVYMLPPTHTMKLMYSYPDSELYNTNSVWC